MIRTLLIATTSAAALFSSPAFAQERGGGTASIPDFSGLWGNPYLYGIEPPPSGPGPVVNKMRQRQLRDVDGRPLPPANAPLVSEARQLVGMWTRTEHLQFSVMMGLRDGLKSIRGMRRALKHKVAEKIVAHLESHNWKIEKGPPAEWHGQHIIPPR